MIRGLGLFFFVLTLIIFAVDIIFDFDSRVVDLACLSSYLIGLLFYFWVISLRRIEQEKLNEELKGLVRRIDEVGRVE